jgi:CBS domain containing-hemolysin-like protein
VLRGETPDLRAVARPPVFVSDTMSLSNFLRELQLHRQQCAVVLDEHGTAIGLAFREDALEEIVGPLGDEFDDEEPDFVELPDGAYEVRGRMPLPELEDRLDFDLPEEEGEEEDSVGGHVTARLGRLPEEGDSVRVGPYVATVVDASHRRAQTLQVALAEPDSTETDDVESSPEET